VPTNKSNEKGRLKSFLFYYLFIGDICLKKPKIIFENKAIFICIRHSNQSVSLRSFPLFRSAVLVGRAFLHSTDTSHVLFLHSVGRLHPQYRFIPLHSASYAPLYFSRIMPAALRFSAVALFAPPSGLAPLP
jgi:hypothetical protein